MLNKYTINPRFYDQCKRHARVESRNAFFAQDFLKCNDLAHRFPLCSLFVDLLTGRQRNQWISHAHATHSKRMSLSPAGPQCNPKSYLIMPPPAPARAWATLSDIFRNKTENEVLGERERRWNRGEAGAILLSFNRNKICDLKLKRDNFCDFANCRGLLVNSLRPISSKCNQTTFGQNFISQFSLSFYLATHNLFWDISPSLIARLLSHGSEASSSQQMRRVGYV